MKRRLLAGIAALVVGVGGGSAVATAPAHASDAWGVVCNLNSNAWLFAAVDGNGGYFVLRTLHAGRGFRWHGQGVNDYYGRNWFYGHGAEAPDQDGWVLASHLSGC